jgi:hypothetical protein
MNDVLAFPLVKPLPMEAAGILDELERAIDAALGAAERLRECAAEIGNAKHFKSPAFEVDRERKSQLFRRIQTLNLTVIDHLETRQA